MSELRLADGVADTLVAQHAAAADGIVDAGEAVPTEVDGGLAAELVAGILVGLLRTATRAAEVSAGTADLVRDVERHLGDTEGQVAIGLRTLRSELS